MSQQRADAPTQLGLLVIDGVALSTLCRRGHLPGFSRRGGGDAQHRGSHPTWAPSWLGGCGCSQGDPPHQGALHCAPGAQTTGQLSPSNSSASIRGPRGNASVWDLPPWATRPVFGRAAVRVFSPGLCAVTAGLAKTSVCFFP